MGLWLILVIVSLLLLLLVTVPTKSAGVRFVSLLAAATLLMMAFIGVAPIR